MRAVWGPCALLSLALLSIALPPSTHAYQDSGVRRASFWPLLPSSATSGTTTLLIDPSSFEFRDVSTAPFSNVPDAIQIYKQVIFGDSGSARLRRGTSAFRHFASGPSPVNTLRRLEVSAVDPVSHPPAPSTDESFELEVPDDSDGVATLRAVTYVGVLRGLETFSQMLIFGVVNGSAPGSPAVFHIPQAPWRISDLPYFSHRGVLVDPARTFLPIQTLKLMVDALLYSKMNVLHLHLADSQSFPVQLTSYPNITLYGAYSEEQVYHPEDIAELVKYALDRGVRVIPEIESSSHSRVFGLAPELQSIVACAQPVGSDWSKYCAEPPCGQVNPADPNTVPVVSQVLQEIGNRFPDAVMHLGFDEINQNCWLSDKRFQQYIAARNFTVGQALLHYYVDLHAALQTLGNTKTFAYWEEAALQTPPLPLQATDTIQVWNTVDILQKVLATTPAQVVVSLVGEVYLDCGMANIFGDLAWCKPYNTWLSMFQADILANVTRPADQQRVKGGEACIWGEIEGPSNVMQNAWPRVAAYGGRLWNYHASSPSQKDIVLAMSDHTQRLLARGVPASPVTVPTCSISPEYCFD